MKIIRNTLKPVLDCWTDPGDYPSNMGAGPLPDGPLQVVDIEGEVVVNLTLKELSQIFEVGFDAFLELTDGIELPDGVLSVEWQLDAVVFGDSDYNVHISCKECEADPDWRKDYYDEE